LPSDTFRILGDAGLVGTFPGVNGRNHRMPPTRLKADRTASTVWENAWQAVGCS
jgi:hypothetical protein